MGTSERYRVLVQLERDLTSRRDLQDVLYSTLHGLHQLIDFDGGSIQLLDDDGFIRLAASDPPAPDEVQGFRVPLGSSVAGRILLTEQPVYIPDVLEDGRVSPSSPKYLSNGVRAYYGVPLLAEGRAIGLLQIDGPTADPWSDEERLLVMSVAPVVAAAIQNARAHRMQREATERLREIENRHDEVERILNENLRTPAAALARDSGAACQLAAGTSEELQELLRAVHERALGLAESVAGLAYVVHARRAPTPSDDGYAVEETLSRLVVEVPAARN